MYLRIVIHFLFLELGSEVGRNVQRSPIRFELVWEIKRLLRSSAHNVLAKENFRLFQWRGKQ